MLAILSHTGGADVRWRLREAGAPDRAVDISYPWVSPSGANPRACPRASDPEGRLPPASTHVGVPRWMRGGGAAENPPVRRGGGRRIRCSFNEALAAPSPGCAGERERSHTLEGALPGAVLKGCLRHDPHPKCNWEGTPFLFVLTPGVLTGS